VPTDRAAVWQALLDQRERAVRVARARCGSPTEVDDCVQEAMTRIAAMPDVDVERVGPLLSTVVANLAMDGHRVRSRARRHQHRVAALVQPSHDSDVCDVAEARWLWAQRRDLSSQDRRVIELRADGYSIQQAAVELGITYKAAENALGRARRSLRAVWRATASLVGILCGGRLRPRAASPAVALASVAALAVAVSLGGQHPASPATPAPTDRPAAVRDVQAAVVSGNAAARAARAGGELRNAAAARRSHAQTAGRGLVATPAVSVGPVHGAATHGEIRRGNESFLETTTDCLQRGVVVTVRYVGCPS
jgi:RNA polymerase sigma factor (sigma-70 family)